MDDSNNKEIYPAEKGQYGSLYQEHFFEQYKILVESIEKNSDRRQSANNYFIAINGAFITILGLTFQIGDAHVRLGARILLGIAGIVASIIFWLLIRAYKQLATGKFKVLHKIEERLPIALYRYEWKILDGGKKWSTYFPFSHIEMKFPWFFAVGYLVLLILTILKLY